MVVFWLIQFPRRRLCPFALQDSSLYRYIRAEKNLTQTLRLAPATVLQLPQLIIRQHPQDGFFNIRLDTDLNFLPSPVSIKIRIFQRPVSKTTTRIVHVVRVGARIGLYVAET